MRIAYLTTEYPKVSHTFIRRELRALESRGHVIDRFSIRRSDSFVDEADRVEAERTQAILSQPVVTLLVSTVAVVFRRPLAFMRAIRTMITLSRASDRGVVRHVAYLIEATVLLRVLARRDVEHLHVHFGTNAASVALLARELGGPPYSMTIHGPDEFDSPIGGSLGLKVRRSAFTVAITAYCVSQIRRWIDYADWSKIGIVHCTVGPEFLEVREPVPEDCVNLTCIGRLAPQKGQPVLLEAFAKLKERGVHGHLTLVGDGELRHLLEERIAELGISDSVVITGWVDEKEIRRQILASRALVLPSFAEGLPVAIMEAFALGRPVITTRITGIPELVEDQECGWLVTPSDVAALADAMQEALEASPERLAKMGAEGRSRVELEHSTEIEAGKLEKLILGVAQAKQ